MATELGRVVPVKFQLTGASASITNATANFYKRRIADATGASVNETETATTVTGGTSFRYDAGSGQYVYNWSTQGLQQGVFELRVDLGDAVMSGTVMLKLVTAFERFPTS